MNGDLAAREEAIRTLFPLVRALARRVGRLVPAADRDDLVGDGALGLLRAVDTFDPSRGTALPAYARRLIVGAMLNGLRRLDPVSERVRRTIRQAEVRRYALAQARGTLPGMLEMEAHDPQLRRARTIAYRLTPLSLDAPLPGDNGALADARGEPSQHVEREARALEVRRAVETLPARHRRVVALHYFGERSLHAIGAALAVSPQRASQLHVSALEKLRAVLDAP